MREWNKMLIALAIGLLLTSSLGSAQQQPKLRRLRIALPSNTIGATHFYVGKSLGIFESYGFEAQILVLEPRAALAALLTETGLTEIEYAIGDRRIRVARAAGGPVPLAAASAPSAAAGSIEHPGAVKAPIVGTAYLAPQPGAPPFVRLGDIIVDQASNSLILSSNKPILDSR